MDEKTLEAAELVLVLYIVLLGHFMSLKSHLDGISVVLPEEQAKFQLEQMDLLKWVCVCV